MRTVLGVILLFVVGSAQAAVVTWSLNDVVFEDLGTATGSFDYDADTNVYSDVAILTTAWSSHSATSYSGLEFGFTRGIGTERTACGPEEGECRLELLFEPLTNAGGVRALTGFEEAEFFGGDRRYVIAGTLSAVPLPAAVWLFGSALAGLGWMRRRQTA